MKDFAYLQPASIEEALSALASLGEGAHLLAGGTDLLVRMKRNITVPTHVINLKKIPDLNVIRADGAAAVLRLGALTTLGEIESSPVVKEHCPVLAATAGKMASAQVRNLATVGGNLCNASPAADTAPPLLALDAAARILSPRGERMLPLSAFFTGPGQTALARDEILAEVLVPLPAPGTVAAYLKHGIRRAMDIAIVGVAVCLRTGPGNPPRAEHVRIALGAVAPTPIRAYAAERVLAEKGLGEDAINEAARTASLETRPISDIRSSAEYRTEMVRVLTRRAIRQCLEQTSHN